MSLGGRGGPSPGDEILERPSTADDTFLWLPLGYDLVPSSDWYFMLRDDGTGRKVKVLRRFHKCPMAEVMSLQRRERLDYMALGVCHYCQGRLVQ